MLKWFNKKKKDNKGFTLVELVVVVAILAILVGLLAPQYTKYVERARKSADASNLENMVRAVEITAADPDGNLEPGTYKITITSENTTVDKITDTSGGGTGGATRAGESETPVDSALKSIKDAIAAVVSTDYETTMLKSKKWAKTDNVVQISATIKINDDNSIEVSYSPDELKEYVGKKSKPTVTP